MVRPRFGAIAGVRERQLSGKLGPAGSRLFPASSRPSLLHLNFARIGHKTPVKARYSVALSAIWHNGFLARETNE